ncbi:bifunctional 4-hydroxy-2-oxoglutarate aldolase/2-dehydro-3-deoxy-phosphogluconate aldolase [Mucilaginibacter sp.]|uniref:bifunctional 4-hydroxy-2-oxoglutarate aldolase/2-dehydro-3-deoxy-phosphogluconate aldolase n=1 Tax=Mucilaginibacter sp. TaxID=1882438 RepID=UPI00260E99BA|nr:bifunctional 4-hydroxy-2-oxoglutarate aldolase/2-dehydro-3-deoxy-phosphogluconate aldolase [Mucilaginibacter sp.]MDB4923786.1 dgoA [Mucilaginibacter sp.]
MDNKFYPGLFDTAPIIGIMRNLPQEHLEIIAENYFQSGLTCLEITMNSAGAAENIAKLSKAYAGRLNIGAGTVCTMHDLDKALKAGAQFIVSPIVNKEVISTCVSENVPVYPGAYTPTEIYQAWHSGATMVKVFPASNLGPGYIKEMLAPLDYLKLLPTGGIGLTNFSSYLSAGAKGVGIGSHLFPKDLIQNQDWIAIKQIFTLFKEKYTAQNI